MKLVPSVVMFLVIMVDGSTPTFEFVKFTSLLRFYLNT
jgi:hypothetical protein